MNQVTAYLTRFRNRFFKLVPMREDRDAGVDNHLKEYLENFYTDISGLFMRHPELSSLPCLIEAYNNLAVLCNAENEIDFNKWRSIVLRSTKLISIATDMYTDSINYAQSCDNADGSGIR